MRKGYTKSRDDKIMTPREIAALLYAAKEIRKDPIDYYLFFTQYLLGLRVGEALRLEYSHVSRIDKRGWPVTVMVPTLKRKRLPNGRIPQEKVPVLSHPNILARAFDRTWRRGAARRSRFLFPGASPDRFLGVTPAGKRFKKLLELARIRPEISPHALRHSAASRLRAVTEDATIVGNFLRHKPGTGANRGGGAATPVYLHMLDEDWMRFRGALDLPPLRPLDEPQTIDPADLR